MSCAMITTMDKFDLVFRVNIKSDPLVKATQPIIRCGKCGKLGHTKRSCKVGLTHSEDDNMVNDILMMVTPAVTAGAGGDHNEEDVTGGRSGVAPDETEETEDVDGEAADNEEEEDYDDTEDIQTFNDIFDSVVLQYQDNSSEEGEDDE